MQIEKYRQKSGDKKIERKDRQVQIDVEIIRQKSIDKKGKQKGDIEKYKWKRKKYKLLDRKVQI